MAVQYALVNLENASGTSGPKDLLKTASSETFSSIYPISRSVSIRKNFLISSPRKTRVVQPFYVKVQPVEDGFVAISDISDVYELGETLSQAVGNYLVSLVDELLWLHEHKQSLSLAMLKDLEKLKIYLRLV